ncbi:SacI homology domain-domain-containing protein [Lobosporangium transversale]|uniref:SacI homology domain-domain-containing protein n=1 Tax=Lobosporangium transversale TaxID=64571 RepID=A0A1Y2H039_9FUNG|nr:SacI homology domain-domain-containing protein [Lobosporangium transversale]ORZ27073.1 SacI homology domain-domain-containing protein [Lobosporangium transversale]|eukprot:XP_021884820.1 SacI homology domain-domain-containing protein [Lobosporangium transversale]
MAIHNSLRLYISIDTFTIEPVFNDPSVVTENIVIQRSNGQVRLNAPAGRVPADEEVMSIYGILGIIRLLAGEYMIVVTDRQRVGQIGEHDIFKLKEYKIMPFSRNNLALSEAQTGEEASYISLLHSHLQSAKLHFAYTYDLTHTLQRQAELRGNIQPMWERADERFFWNYRLQSKFIDHTRRHKDQDLGNFILPIINGFVDIKEVEINRKPFTFVLISRRSRHRAGTRYFSRGVDIHGNVSNFNESEQIVVVDTAAQSTIPTAVRNHIMLSHVQTRGSIPIFWTQINNIQYTPKLQIFNDPQTGNAFRRHFEAQKRYYGTQLVINLINKKGYEEPMGTTFSKQIDILSDPDIKYYHFDFHHECSKMRWHRVSLLLDHYHEDLVAQGYFKAEANRHMIQRVYHRQSSVVRTNCMDCLDRTNVVQSVISRWVLNRQLQDVGILAVGEQFETFKQFESVFRDVWADNADIISCAYSGTGALKTDFTRTGKRTKVGALYDLQNSIVRYIKNNFLDGSRQDAYDLFLSYDVHENGSYPLIDDRPLHFKLMPLGLIIGFAMLVSCAIIPESFFSTHVLAFASFWVAVIVYIIHFILANGVYYVNWPRLVPLGYDLAAMTRNHTFESDTTLGTAEVELGWKNE